MVIGGEDSYKAVCRLDMMHIHIVTHSLLLHRMCYVNEMAVRNIHDENQVNIDVGDCSNHNTTSPTSPTSPQHKHHTSRQHKDVSFISSQLLKHLHLRLSVSAVDDSTCFHHHQLLISSSIVQSNCQDIIFTPHTYFPLLRTNSMHRFLLFILH